MESSKEAHEFGGAMEGAEGFIGCLDVFVHQARDIHNICIYHKQDVYAKICVTSDPDAAAATRTINGGGRNPVFNQALRLGVRTLDASLKCEVWMLSRVKNYLEDQLLGFALVPLPDVAAVGGGGILAAEFPLSSTDLFHSPAGFVQLSLSYSGTVPDVLPISPLPLKPAQPAAALQEAGDGGLVPREYEKIEFPDLMLVKENQLMVSEYFGIPCTIAEPQSSESLITTEDGNGPADHEAGVRIVESFSMENSMDSIGAFSNDTPLSSVSTTDSPVVAVPATPQSSSHLSTAVASPDHKDKGSEALEGEVDSSSAAANPMIRINLEQEETVDQKEIADMYMKSMRQFTESLAKMKLPIDINNNGAASGDEAHSSTEEKKTPGSKEKYSRVFYGSRAFF